MLRFNFKTTCPQCGHSFDQAIDIREDEFAPKTCSGLEPKARSYLYEVSSVDIQNYLQEKVKSYNPDAMIVAFPMYAEPTLREWETHRAYAIIPVLFSANLIEDPMINQGAPDWLVKGLGKTKLVKSVTDEVIRRYRLNPDDFNKDYIHAEKLAHQFGISSSFAETARRMIEPRTIPMKNGQVWVLVGLSAVRIIADMLSSQNTKKLEGELFIDDVRKVSNRMVTFTVTIREGKGAVSSNVDPNVATLLEEIVKGKH